jgi:hypothetical protein
MRTLYGLIFGLACLVGGSVRASERINLESVSVRLFLQRSGMLSTDVTSVADFGSWNSEPRGKGIPEGERFDAALIILRFHAAGEVFAKGEQARLTVIGDAGKVVMSSRIRDVYVGPEGITHLAFFLPETSCTRVQIRVVSGGKTVKKTLPFSCGE